MLSLSQPIKHYLVVCYFQSKTCYLKCLFNYIGEISTVFYKGLPKNVDFKKYVMQFLSRVYYVLQKYEPVNLCVFYFTKNVKG